MIKCGRSVTVGALKCGVLVFVIALGLGIGTPSRAEVRIDITRGRVEPTPVAVPDFVASDSNRSVGADVASVVSADLERSGLFLPLDRSAFIQQFSGLDEPPHFADWRTINAQVLVQGAVESHGSGTVRIAFRLWDIFTGQQVLGKSFTAAPDNWRRVAHMISDEIYKRLTGEDGYFDTRIVYVAESGPVTRRVKRLAIMDQDGANHQYLTDGSSMVLTPRFSPTAQEITYMSFYGDSPRVYLYNIDSGRQELLGDFPGMTFAPRFSPDGNKVVLSMAKDGNTDIFEMDLRTRRRIQLTNASAIDTSPSYSPDGHRIVFNSDRGGTQQLYVMDSDGSGVRRISFGEGRYATPVWSPRGDLVAFTKMKGGEFYIGVMKPDGSGERMLSSGFLMESPTWAPNGRVLMYYRSEKSGNPQLYSIDLTGYNERRVITPQAASDPAWSPLLP
ncbi:Tol-Pal system protein TolB [Haematospirillum jordaniae]|uniref:Tol-Pal system beta propeller repeat protein TolB n=1 Tax=Haematospirillum jordaniae TaxID=1549855 RepID=UPI001432DDDF|nr:Tol-Pal system beta propeller repeat protein TolB [Haematospirillum jordaniae]NKD84692.1 Tol-Pal system protein TolB [Haematospirillum jordaniae]